MAALIKKNIIVNKKVLNVDIVKGFAIILVMIGHSGMFLSIKDKALLNSIIYSFHMPLFFILAGFFMKEKVSLKKSNKKIIGAVFYCQYFLDFL